MNADITQVQKAELWYDAMKRVLEITPAQSTLLKAIEKIRRPPNCYMLYQMTKADEVPTQDRRNIAKTVAEMWHQEPKNVKDWYQEKYRQLRIEHRNIYPGHKYSPDRRNSRKKPQTDKNKSVQQMDWTTDQDHNSKQQNDRTSPPFNMNLENIKFLDIDLDINLDNYYTSMDFQFDDTANDLNVDIDMTLLEPNT